jgi:hypothetical protein
MLFDLRSKENNSFEDEKQNHDEFWQVPNGAQQEVGSNTLIFLEQIIVIKEGGGGSTWYMLSQLHIPLVNSQIKVTYTF